MKVLAADIGGTKTLLQIADITPTHHQILFEHRFESRDYSDFFSMVETFQQQALTDGLAFPPYACFAVAGPVKTSPEDQTATITNLPWRLSASSLAAHFGFRAVEIINDFEAVGIGIDALQSNDMVFLQGGNLVAQAPRVIIGAGTGLGVAQMVWRNGRYVVLASEGGHADFAPNNDIQAALLKYLWRRYQHVSYDRILSGPGLVNIYSFLTEHHNVTSQLNGEDPAAAISKSALEQTDPIAIQALDIFIDIYGAQAGNLALLNLAYGGVFVAGGIAPKILSRLEKPDFIAAFQRKGRMVDIIRDMPLAIVLNEKVGLMGAALSASRLG